MSHYEHSYDINAGVVSNNFKRSLFRSGEYDGPCESVLMIWLPFGIPDYIEKPGKHV